MTKVLTKVAYWNPNLDFDAALEGLLEDVHLATLEECIKPVHLAASTPGSYWGSVLEAPQLEFTRRQAYPINVGWTYRGKKNCSKFCMT